MDTNTLEPIGNSYEPVSDGDISHLEHLIGISLPEDYKGFLRRFGRCGFSGDAFVVVGAGRLPIFTFYGGGTGPGSLLQQLELHPDLREIGVLPIADDLFSNIYVLDAREGGISWLEYSAGHVEARRIASSFTDLLGQIDVSPDE
jgi:hypothetical protein